MYTNEALKTELIAVEKDMSVMVGKRIEKVRAEGGNKLANELLASVACLFLSRATAMIHILTGEPIKSVRERMIQTYDFNLTSTVAKVHRQLQYPPEPNG